MHRRQHLACLIPWQTSQHNIVSSCPRNIPCSPLLSPCAGSPPPAIRLYIAYTMMLRGCRCYAGATSKGRGRRSGAGPRVVSVARAVATPIRPLQETNQHIPADIQSVLYTQGQVQRRVRELARCGAAYNPLFAIGRPKPRSPAVFAGDGHHTFAVSISASYRLRIAVGSRGRRSAFAAYACRDICHDYIGKDLIVVGVSKGPPSSLFASESQSCCKHAAQLFCAAGSKPNDHILSCQRGGSGQQTLPAAPPAAPRHFPCPNPVHLAMRPSLALRCPLHTSMRLMRPRHAGPQRRIHFHVRPHARHC